MGNNRLDYVLQFRFLPELIMLTPTTHSPSLVETLKFLTDSI